MAEKAADDGYDGGVTGLDVEWEDFLPTKEGTGGRAVDFLSAANKASRLFFRTVSVLNVPGCPKTSFSLVVRKLSMMLESREVRLVLFAGPLLFESSGCAGLLLSPGVGVLRGVRLACTELLPELPTLWLGDVRSRWVGEARRGSWLLPDVRPASPKGDNCGTTEPPPSGEIWGTATSLGRANGGNGARARAWTRLEAGTTPGPSSSYLVQVMKGFSLSGIPLVQPAVLLGLLLLLADAVLTLLPPILLLLHVVVLELAAAAVVVMVVVVGGVMLVDLLVIALSPLLTLVFFWSGLDGSGFDDAFS